MNTSILDRILQLCEKRGIIYKTAEIYGGLEGAYDYGIEGLLIKNNLMELWRREMVYSDPATFEIEGNTLLPGQIWERSGHAKLFSDSYRECKSCNRRYTDNPIKCTFCGKNQFTEEKLFESMFRVKLSHNRETFLPPEISQTSFLNFNHFVKKNRLTLPFGIAQIGNAYRNEVTPRHFIFKTCSFDQMEIEYFIPPKEGSLKYDQLLEKRFRWYTDNLKIDEKMLRFREHQKDDLAHYSQSTTDIEFKFDFSESEFGEIEGISNRADYDTKVHSQGSGTELSYWQANTQERFYPHVIECSAGIERILLALLVSAYHSEEVNGKERAVLRLPEEIAPYRYAVLPLMKDQALVDLSRELYTVLAKSGVRPYLDLNGSIGRRYRRQDEIGTPSCLTVDFQSIEDRTVTVRDRDTLQQRRCSIDSFA